MLLLYILKFETMSMNDEISNIECLEIIWHV